MTTSKNHAGHHEFSSESHESLVGIDEIELAQRIVSGHVIKTPIVQTWNGLALKAENLQRTGAFKLRGAFFSLLSLSPAKLAAGVIAASSGNHAQAVACAAAQLGVRATVVMPANSPESKRDACRRWGAEVLIHGANSVESMDWTEVEAERSGRVEIQAFNSRYIIAATGAIGLEILEEMRDVSAIWVPISGGGLISGIASAVKAKRPSVRIIGVEPALANDAELSFRAGRRIGLSPEDAARTAADGLRVPILGNLTWPHIQAFVDDIVSVDEKEMAAAARWIMSDARMISEISGAAAAAAALRHSDRAGMVAVVSGGNIDIAALATLTQGARSE